MTTSKQDLHVLIDRLPDDPRALERAASLIRLIRPVSPLPDFLRNLPEDDEPLTDDEATAISEGLAALAEGDVVDFEEIRREFGS